jgi:hypothetical protein
VPDENLKTVDAENVRTIYRELCTSYRAIDDFRGKLLAALPLASGTGIFLLIREPGKEVTTALLLPIGVFGLLVTLGLFVFEVYGIRRCTHLIVFGEWLEGQLRIEAQFKHRPHGLESFPLLPKWFAPFISEPLASGFIYPAVLAAWAFVALFQDKTLNTRAAFIALAVFLLGFSLSLVFNLWLGTRDVKHKRTELGLAD